MKLIRFIIAWFRVPRGQYCHSCVWPPLPNKTCLYWKKIKGRPHQEDGWCDYLKKGDAELLKERYSICVYPESMKGRTCEGFSLLWDKCKECGIKLKD